MNDPVNDPISSTSHSDLEQQVLALQRQMLLLLVALIVVTATLTGFLAYQSHIGSVDLNASRPRYLQLIQQYQDNQAMIDKFENELVQFGATHPAFQPVLKQYGLGPSGSKSPTAPATP
ncbi:MAG TPA: hypothetical protein VME24_09630 [Alphaproteobacteria bacterium]|nr:hypothetical protein [Alphaproteobacteria bacterium]